MSSSKPPPRPDRLRQVASYLVMGATGLVCRAFLYGLNNVNVVGLDKFLALLDSRKDVNTRKRGLVTVSNHICVMDDPIIWGVLPLRYTFDQYNLRWSLGAHDICYKNNVSANFFFSGQTLPTHRLRYSSLGGLFQPTLTQAIRLLSAPSPPEAAYTSTLIPQDSWPVPVTTSSQLLTLSVESNPSPYHFSTNGIDHWPAPSSIAANRLSWVHVFPEGSVHQQHERGLRYFKWGVARLILESEPAPDVVPMFIDGLDRVMASDRKFPRFIPRGGQSIHIAFGDILGPDTFADLRTRWRQLVQLNGKGKDGETELKDGQEARKIRTEVARRLREEVLKLRRKQGYPDEDPTHGLAETWASDPHMKHYRSKVDGSLVDQE